MDSEWWDKVEIALKCTIPTYIKNLLTMCGYDNIISLRCISENYTQHVEVLENFARIEMEHFRDQNKPAKDYYGLYAKCPKKFKILPGHKYILTALGDYCTQISESKCISKKLTPLSNVATSSSSSKSSHNQMEKSIDLNYEEKNLTKLIKSTILRFIETEDLLLQDVTEKLSKIKINMKIDSQSQLYFAIVDCFFCSIKLKVFKLKNRWITSNYGRHLRKQHTRNKGMHTSEASIINALGNQIGPQSSLKMNEEIEEVIVEVDSKLVNPLKSPLSSVNEC